MARTTRLAKPRTGSSMSSKQMAYSVRHGRKVILRLRSGNSQEGYLCGEDSFHWRIIRPDGRILLVHKAGVELVEFLNEATYDDEPRRDELEKAVGPFREFVEVYHFGRTEGGAANE